MSTKTVPFSTRPGHRLNEIQNHGIHQETDADAGTYAQVEVALQELQSLEQKHYWKSRFRRFSRCVEPLVDFILMYSPAVDILVQYDVSPSTVVWGSLRSLLKIAQNSIKYYDFISRMLTKIADVVSISAKYQKLYSQDKRVMNALAPLYLQVLSLLQRIRTVISSRSFNVVMKSIFRTVDIEFQHDLERLSRLKGVFEEEVTLAHRQHIETHLKEQQLASLSLDTHKDWTNHQLRRDHPQFVEAEIAMKKSIMIWLGQVNVPDAFQRAAIKRCADTGQWLLQNASYRQWISSASDSIHSRMLWIHGAPGAGKTTLCGATIQDMKNAQSCAGATDGLVTYFFGDRTDKAKGTALDIFASSLSQVLSQLQEWPEVISSAYRSSTCQGRSRISEMDDIFYLFTRVASSVSPLFIILDALDECSDIPRITSWLIRAIELLPGLRILCFSRTTGTIQRALKCYPTLSMDAATVQPDIDKYLESAVKDLPCTDSNLKHLVFNTLSKKAAGMFLFANLSIKTLRSAVNVADLLRLLNTLPSGINEMYEFILKRLCTESQVRQYLAHRVFVWVCTAARPLAWDELRNALSWDADMQIFDKDKEPFKDAVMELCSPLIEYHHQTDVVRLTHSSVYEYLCETPQSPGLPKEMALFSIQPKEAQQELAMVTLALLTDDIVSRSIRLNVTQYPLITYATKNWCHHLSQSPFHPHLYVSYTIFAQSEQIRATWILRWLLTEEWSFPLQQIVTLQKLVQDWVINGSQQPLPSKVILGDIQKALFTLDQLPLPSLPSNETSEYRPISNFERLVCVRDLAREYTMGGELDAGVAMFEQAITEAEKANDQITSKSCWLLNSLGILYDQQGRTETAKETQLRALACQELSLPPHSLDIVLTINELGRIARHLEQYKDAEVLHRDALRSLEESFPETDLHVTWTKSALGRALLKQGLPDEALELHKQVLTVETARLGRAHPHTLWTLSDMARCYRDQGNLEDAISTQLEVMERNGEVLGAENPDTLWSMNSLALLYEAFGRPDLAKNLHSKAFEGQKNRLGGDHKHTCWSRDAVARLDEAARKSDVS